MSELHDHAVAYAQQGLPVFPLQPKSKHPYKGFRWREEATANVDTVRTWWKHHPDSNIALATGIASGIWVLDVDLPEGPKNLEILFLKKMIDHPTTLRIRTGSGGLQYLFRMPDDNRDIGNSTSKLGNHLDVRGTGGYVILPPSIHPNGSEYQWEI